MKELKKELKQEGKNIKDIFNRIKKKDFSGNTGIAIKNSIYQFSTTFVAKIGSLIFTIILARLLMPELFGLYSLALSTLLLFISFTDLGLESGLILFLSKAISQKNKSKAKSYLFYISKIKLVIVLIIISILLILSHFLSDIYYQKPIFIALLVGSLYVFFRTFVSFFKSIFYATNNFKQPLIWEITFQISRLIVVPLVIILFLNSMISDKSNIYIVILALTLSWFLTLLLILYSFFSSIKFIKAPSEKLPKEDKIYIKKALLPLSTITFSGIFFGYIDIFVLGRFVLSEFIGFYQAAFSLVGSITALITFSTVLLPIFSRIKGKRLEKALSKSIKNIRILTLLVGLITFIISPLLIKIVFGESYIDSIILLRIFSLIIFIMPLNSIYASNLISKEKSKVLAKLLILTTLVNILLNYSLAFLLKEVSQMAVVIGICGATVFSKYLYFFLLFIASRKKN